jgi:hypothetical protein
MLAGRADERALQGPVDAPGVVAEPVDTRRPRRSRELPIGVGRPVDFGEQVEPLPPLQACRARTSTGRSVTWSASGAAAGLGQDLSNTQRMVKTSGRRRSAPADLQLAHLAARPGGPLDHDDVEAPRRQAQRCTEPPYAGPDHHHRRSSPAHAS